MKRLAVALAVSTVLAGCASVPRPPQVSHLPVLPRRTASAQALMDLPPPSKPVAIAVYGFTDQTGQFKPVDQGQTLSRAVSQGGASILMKALQDAGQRRWFTIVEREQLKNLLSERQIIREMRERYLGERDVNPQALPSLLFAGVLLEGGVIGYDSNTLTGGAGAGLLGISAQTQYRQDTVTVYLRAVSVRTGEVLNSVTASKTIASYQVGANAFSYVDYKKLLEAETGITTNEPDQLCLQQAIEKAVYALIMDGIEQKLWTFADAQTGAPYLHNYQLERDGVYSAGEVERLNRRLRRDRPATIAPQAAARPPAPARPLAQAAPQQVIEGQPPAMEAARQ